jgi:hypothetical protein
MVNILPDLRAPKIKAKFLGKVKDQLDLDQKLDYE